MTTKDLEWLKLTQRRIAILKQKISLTEEEAEIVKKLSIYER